MKRPFDLAALVSLRVPFVSFVLNILSTQRAPTFPKVHKGGLLLLLLLLSQSAFAQETDTLSTVNPRFAKISLIARTDKDSVVLRWAPSRPGGWRIANRLGYIIERM